MSSWASVGRLLATDRLLRLALVVHGLALAVLALAPFDEAGPIGSALPLVDPLLIAVTLAALLWGRRRLADRERRFWDLLALAWACRLIVEAFFFLDLSVPLVSASFVTDALFVLFYLIFALAVDVRPHAERVSTLTATRRRVESIAGVTVAFGVLIYFAIVVLPDPLGISLSFLPRDHGYTPLLLVRSSLDAFLLFRLTLAWFTSRGRWARLYGLLASGMACFTLKDVLSLMQLEGLVTFSSLGIGYGVFLMLPGLFVLIAARWRHLGPVGADGGGDRERSEEQDADVMRTNPLAVYALVVPVLHFLLYPLGLLEPESRQTREVFALIYMAVLGSLALVHQRVLVRESREASRALRKAEERLVRSQRLESVGRLAGGIAHDFNNYLTVILGYVELMRGRLRDPEAVAACGHVEDAAVKATTLTRQLLAYGRRQKLRPEPLDLNEVVRDTVRLLESLLGEGVTVRLDLDDDVGLARADLGQTEQVLMNLALNARDAMPSGGTLSIRTRRTRLTPSDAAEYELESGPYVVLVIEDTGCGMTDEVRARALEPFFTTKAFGEGTGLGLSTVYGIVAQSGGAMNVDSAHGRGTTIRVVLPGVEAQYDAARESSAQASTSASTEGSLEVPLEASSRASGPESSTRP